MARSMRCVSESGRVSEMNKEPIDTTDGCAMLLLDRADTATENCCDAVLDVGSAATRAELSVTFPRDITDRGRLDTGTTGRQPGKHGQLTVGDVLRSTDRTPPEFDAPVATDIVEDPENLPAIGTSISRFCETWSRDGYRIVLCFDSLTRLLDHVEPESTFRFLHTLLERLDGVDAVAHFHIGPVEHDEQLLSTFSTLFDEVVDPAEPGELLDDPEPGADADSEPALSDGIPATSGSSQASDGDIAARLDERDGGKTDQSRQESGGRQEATDDDIAARLEGVDESTGEE